MGEVWIMTSGLGIERSSWVDRLKVKALWSDFWSAKSGIWAKRLRRSQDSWWWCGWINGWCGGAWSGWPLDSWTHWRSLVAGQVWTSLTSCLWVLLKNIQFVPCGNPLLLGRNAFSRSWHLALCPCGLTSLKVLPPGVVWVLSGGASSYPIWVCRDEVPPPPMEVGRFEVVYRVGASFVSSAICRENTPL